MFGEDAVVEEQFDEEAEITQVCIFHSTPETVHLRCLYQRPPSRRSPAYVSKSLSTSCIIGAVGGCFPIVLHATLRCPKP